MFFLLLFIGKGWEYPPTVKTGVGLFVRREMPQDNSCLFHSIAYVCQNRQTGSQVAFELRTSIAEVVAQQPGIYNATFLGTPNQMYQNMILNPDTWGGAIELSIFSILFQVLFPL